MTISIQISQLNIDLPYNMLQNNIFQLRSDIIANDQNKIHKTYVYTPGDIYEEPRNDVDRVSNIIKDSEELKQMFAKELEPLCRPRKCMNCKRKYTETQNFQWLCAMHPKGPDPNDYTKYACCGKSIIRGGDGYEHRSSKGCFRSDHIHTYAKHNPKHTQDIPIALVKNNIIKLEKNHLNVLDTVTNTPIPYYVVSRVETDKMFLE